MLSSSFPIFQLGVTGAVGLNAERGGTTWETVLGRSLDTLWADLGESGLENRAEGSILSVHPSPPEVDPPKRGPEAWWTGV